MLKPILLTVCLLGVSSLAMSVSADLPDANKMEALQKALKNKVNEYKLLVNVKGRCLESPPDQAKNNGGKIQLWDCNNSKYQRWKLDSQQRLVNTSGKCLDIAGPDLHKNGGSIGLWECNNAPNQKWTLDKGRLRSVGGKCLDIPGEANWNRNGMHLHIWDCNTAPNQRWDHKLWWGK
ncbi:RICIN domain-containing protein [Candidatus Venteria ishoeyi]|uniref:Endo-1,4-beta-xylanase A n=1 Tax=Candidatus Venteria ishoeyi TaxID=1899563 RepID=A0A1H6F2L2_9GAMM|nr:RICIN domain-containing protein [Candidatus Venteria ishoeyi]MDM8546219.1 RICIN domain-containing protein [Candidatus Venteria ishoeyi]SEH04360.1 Endo-1%2C4-beta-xylanase A precursor [Candidatus Venteria ishoeyi]